MNLNSKQKSLCQLATAELFPNDTGKQQKMTNARLGMMPLVSGSVAIGNPELHVRKASHRGSKQQ